MQVAARPVVIGSSALIASSLIAATPVTSPLDLQRVSTEALRLVDANSVLSDLGGLSSLVSDLGGLGAAGTSSFDLSGLLNIPYNVFADIVNIPYYESLALEEYAYALGPAGMVGGVPGWIPPGATVDNGGIDPVTDQYALGGTGSWWMESMGNTWGWDNGNWPQVDGLIHFLLPFQWTEAWTEQIQSLAQSEIIDGSAVNCEFECSNVLGYIGGWFQTPIQDLLSPTYTFPNTVTDTIGANSSTGIINVGPPGTEDLAIWSGQPGTFNPLAFLDAWGTNLTQSPADNPIMLPNIADVFTNVLKLGGNIFNDWFNAFQEGSFVYWGASTMYSIPSVIGGLLHDFTGLPNEFVLPNNGAEPLSGYTDGPAQLLPNLVQGADFVINGLLKYLDPSTYSAASTDFTTMLSSLGDPTALLGDLNSLLPNIATELASMLGPQLSADLGSLLPQLATSLIP